MVLEGKVVLLPPPGYTLVPEIGYDQVAEIAKTAHERSISIKEAALLLTNIPEKKLDELLDARKMTN